MEKKRGSSSTSSGSQRPSQRKIIGAKAMQINEDEAARLVGSIVEKGISSKPHAPSSAPQPTVLPFPVARHRSHGPHWSPFGSKMGGGNDKKADDDSSSDVGEDMDLSGFDNIGTFAHPIKRKQKKGLDFSNWRELVPSDNSFVSAGKKDKVLLAEFKEQNDKGKTTENAEKRMMSSYASLADADVLNHKEMKGESGLNSVANKELHKLDPVPDSARTKSEVMNSTRPRSVVVQANQGQVNMEEQETQSSHRTPGSENFGIDQGAMTLEIQIDAENRAQLERMSPEEIEEAQAEIMEKLNPTLLKMLKKRGQAKLKKQKCAGLDLPSNGQLDNRQDENPLTQDTKSFSLMEGDNSHMVTETAAKDTQKGQETPSSHRTPRSENFGIDQGAMTLESQIDAENRAQLERMSPKEIKEAQAEIMEKLNPTLLKMLKKRGQAKLKKQKCAGSDLPSNGQLDNRQDENQLTQDTKGFSLMEGDNSHMVAEIAAKDTQKGQKTPLSHRTPGSENFGIDPGAMTLESQIDAENRAQLERMSPEEIEEAQAEIMEKLNPTLLKMLKKLGQAKLKKQKCPGLDLSSNGQLDNQQDENQLTQDNKGFSLMEGDNSHMVTETAAKDTQKGQDNVALKNSGPGSSSLWNAWSERVEAARELRFSLDGTAIENDFVQVSKTDSSSVRSGYNADNVTERDFIRTEGDPGAAGYTIKEALTLTRSMVPVQRALAFHLLGSVLFKALDNIHRYQVGNTIKSVNNSGQFIDWEAVWAYALGPEPELVLALRMSLDDNHKSVVLACAKVVQCVLSCDMNEYFFDVSERLATCEKVLCTAPVFRSRPEIELGFLHGGFWKYNTKPSNIFPPNQEIVDDKSEETHTIQDDIVIAGQDFAAGLVRMGILPRIQYLLETNPTVALEECIISILIAIARHSPTCANAIIKCERLVQTVVSRFAEKDKMAVYPSKIKSVTLLKVLAQSDKKICIEFIKSGIFQDATSNLYQCPLSLDQWIKSGKENCKYASALMVEQLRFWKVCIQYGYCVSYFGDFFPALFLWLNPPKFEKLILNNVLNEFAAITAEAYLVLETLARRLPNFMSHEHTTEPTVDDQETWSWIHVGPIVNGALKWIAFKTNPDISRSFGQQKGTESKDLSLRPLLWVISAAMHMLSSVLKRVIPEDSISLPKSGRLLPGLPEFVSKIGLEVITNWFTGFSGVNDKEYGNDPSAGGSFIGKLCDLRLHGEYEISLASTHCLHGLVQQVVSLDNLIQLAKIEIQTPLFQGHGFSKEGKVLEGGILKWSLIELKSVLVTFMKLVASEWDYVQSVEVVGRGGPAPGVGLGWGASGGGFWSKTVLLAQTDAELFIHLLEIFPLLFSEHITLALDENMTFNIQKINSALEVCLTVGPRNKATMEKALDILLQVPVLKYLDLCIHCFLHLNREIKQFGWVYQEEDFLIFSKMLASHFRKRWLCVKKKFKVEESKTAQKVSTKGSGSLDTIPEDMDLTNTTIQDHDCPSLLVEWTHQRFPLPMHWFLSPISTLHDGKLAGLPSTSNIQNLVKNPADIPEVARGGLFFILGIEAMSSFLPSHVPSPVWSVPVIWKLHSLSVILLDGMSVLEEEKSRDVYEALQELYGRLLDESRVHKSAKPILSPETGKKNSTEFLRFQSDIHESYSTFIEALVEQFAAISYGDLMYGRQVAIYLHRSVEAPVRLAAWNALSNARVLELLPSLEKCFADVEGYLEPVEDNEGILEAYVKSWVTGALDRAATRGSITFTLVLHHVSSFIFEDNADDKLPLQNKLTKSLLRDYSRKQRHEGLMLQLIQYNKQFTSQPEWTKQSETEKRFRFLTEACEGNASLLKEVEKLKSSFRMNEEDENEVTKEKNLENNNRKRNYF